MHNNRELLSVLQEVQISRNEIRAKKAAVLRYLATEEGKNFVITNLIAEVARSYYELRALDNELAIVEQNIAIQSNALSIVNIQKQAAKATELAVRKFEAEVLKTKGLRYEIRQDITEVENRINFLIGRYPQHIMRSTDNFVDQVPHTITSGIPAQLLTYRPDIREAEKKLAATGFDVKSAKAAFYPQFRITGGVGMQAFNAIYLIKRPESLLFSLAGDLVAPVINRNEIKTKFLNAHTKQQQAIYDYEQTILHAYDEVANQLANISNLSQGYDMKARQVAALSESINISIKLFKSARADYMEVLMTQRDALEARFELIEIKQRQLQAVVNMYHALGGGWQ